MNPNAPGYDSSDSYLSLSVATTAGSASVVVSPSARPSAMSRRSRRMILPDRVFGSSAEKMMSSGRASEPIFFATCDFSSSDHRRLGDRLVVHERGLDLHRRDAVARDVHHVVHAPEQPEVAVFVALRPVAGEVDVVVLRPVLLDVAVRVTPDPAQHRRIGLPDDQVAGLGGVPLLVEHVASTPGKDRVAEPGLSVVMPGSGVMRIWPVSVCHQVSTTGQRPPPITFQYQTHASGLIGSPTVPRSLRLERSQRLGYASPHFMNVRIAVGAV